MPRLTEATKRARRENILVAAFQCFAEKGFASTSMADIIEAAGISAGAMYSHFESKSELVRTIAQDLLESRRELFHSEEDGEALAPGELLKRFLADFMDREHARVLLQVWSTSLQDPELEGLVQEFLGWAQELFIPLLETWARQSADLTEEQVGDAAERALFATLTAVHGCVVRLALDSSVDREHLITMMVYNLNSMRFA